MTLAELKNMVDEALETQNPAIVADCEGYYSPYYQLFYLLACHFEKATPMGSPLFVELGVDKGRGSFSMLQGWATVIGVEQNDKECFSMSHPNLTLLKCSSTPVPKAIRSIPSPRPARSLTLTAPTSRTELSSSSTTPTPWRAR
jgi:hypothetical protein